MEINDTFVWAVIAAFAALIVGAIIVYGIGSVRSYKAERKKLELTPTEKKQIKDEFKKTFREEQAALFKTDEVYKKIDGFDMLTTKRSKINIWYWVDWWKQRKKTNIIFLVTMYLNNGFRKRFLITHKDGGFTYKGKEYVIDEDSKTWGIDSRMYELDYVEGISLPIKMHIPAKRILDTLKSINIKDIELGLTRARYETSLIQK